MKRYVNFIFISSDWLHYHRREFTKSLSENIKDWGEVVVVEAPVSLTVNLFIKFKSRLLSWLKGNLKPGKKADGLVFITPLILFHIKLWERSGIFGKTDCFLINKQLRSFIKKNYKDHKISYWFYEPEHYMLALSNLNSKIVYDYYDDHEFNYDGSIKPDKVRKNKILVSEADLTVCLSKFTTERLSNYGDNVIYLKNSSSLKSYYQNEAKNVDEYYSFKKDKKLIGYLGTVRNWIDFSYIEEVLKNIEDANLVLVGPVLKNVEKEVDKLRKYKNFFTVGFVHPDQIYDHIKKFDAGIIPFKVNNFTKSVFPNKFFEYAVCNVPVVSTNLPELEEYRDDIGYAATPKEFSDFCRNALNGNFKDKIIRNRKNAEENTWDISVAGLNKILKKKFGIEEKI